MIWKRHFEDHGAMVSRFVPYGTAADGHLLEETGHVRMKLTVDVVDGGWYWRTLGISLGPLPLPLALLPQTRAFKKMEGENYRFVVELRMPLIGTVLSYGGLLSCTVHAAADSAPSAPT